MTSRLNVNRRQFVITTSAAGGGMAIGLRFPGAVNPALAAPGDAEINAWVVVNADDTIILRIPVTDQGNGASTGVAQMVCEELSCAWDKVRIEFADIKRHYAQNRVYQQFSQRASGFRSTAQKMGAIAREHLKLAAAQQWNVPVEQVEANAGILTHRPTNRTLRFGEMAAKAATLKLDKEPAIKPADQWTFAGKVAVPKATTRLVVNGSAKFGVDVRLPNMLYAAVKQSPVHGGKVKSFDFNAIKDRPGVRAAMKVDATPDPSKLPDPGSALMATVVVVADTYWQAKSALEVLPIEWDDGAGAKFANTDAFYKPYYDALEKPSDITVRSQGDAANALKSASRIIEGVYMTPLQDHHLMEPMNATAQVTADRVDVWAPTPSAETALAVAVHEGGLTREKTNLHETLMGGSFGRRNAAGEVRLAVAVAKQLQGPLAGRPVMTLWSREETTRQGRYRPINMVKMQGAIGADGMPTALFMRAASVARNRWVGAPLEKVEKGEADSGAIRALVDAPYWTTIPNVKLEYNEVENHVLLGPWRSPGWNSNIFFLESFIDELAHAAKIDEMEYRRKLLAKWPDPGWLKCLNECTTKAGWGKQLPKGTAQGFGIGSWSTTAPGQGTIVANVATVSLSQGGQLKVEQVDVAFDTGSIINLSEVLSNAQAGVVWGLTETLYHELNIRNGRIVEGNFDDAPMVRIDEAPVVNVHLGGLTGGTKFTGLSEAMSGPIQSAVTNAIFKITGRRIRSLPLKNHDLSWS